MVRRALILKLFDAFSIQRWNDKVRPVELTEMDKHAHKMVITYCLAKYESDSGKEVNWLNIIKGGVYELLRRVVLSDIKSPIYRKIRENKEVFDRLNTWVYKQLAPSIDNAELKSELENYLTEEERVLDPLSINILSAAHIYATYWEFQIIKHAHPQGYQISEIDRLLLNDIESHLNLIGMQKILTKEKITDFIDLLGQLRFQIRWSGTPRMPLTSVLGHSMMVASLAYFFSLEIGACPERVRNNFFGGLFHDLPEAVTRDIISPIKGAVEDLSEVIGAIERELVELEIYPLIEKAWIQDIKYFTESEFDSKIVEDGKMKKVATDDINASFNNDHFHPIDGQLIRVVDHLSAFVEAFIALQTGIKTPQLEDGEHSLRTQYKGKVIGGIDVGAIYADFV